MKLELLIPTSLSEIPLKHYQEFVKTRENSNDEEFIAQKMIEIFCGIELKDVVKMKLSDVNDLIVHFNKLFESKPKFQHRFNIGEIEYGFIPKLEDITLEEFSNLEQLMKSWDTFHMALAVMYRPIKQEHKGKYLIHDYVYSEDMGEAFKYCPLNVALSAQVFFWTLSNELLNAIPSYLETEMKKNKNLTNEINSATNGDGIQVIINSLEETLKHLPRLESINYLNV